MAVLTPVVSKRSGNGVSIVGAAAAGGGDSFVNTGKEVLCINNQSVAPITVTVVTPATIDGLAVADLAVVVPASGFQMVGPFPPAIYNDTAVPGGSVSLTYSGVTTLFVAVAQVPQL